MNLNTEQYFSTVPSIEAPRSTFDRSFSHKMTMNVNYLYPIFVDEALPGDSMKMDFQAFGRIVNPLVVPVMDELYFETLWFKCDNRLLWNHWVNFCGEQANPSDSVDYVLPTINSSESATPTTINNVFTCGELADCMGIPPYIGLLEVNSLPFRMYNRIYNEWFRDENLVNSVTLALDDSDSASNYGLLKSAKIHDYFTSCLPFAQKGDSVNLPYSLTINQDFPVYGNGKSLGLMGQNGTTAGVATGNAGSNVTGIMFTNVDSYGANVGDSRSSTTTLSSPYVIGVTTDSTKSGLVAHINYTNSNSLFSISDFRFAMKLQEKRERDAIGGTRYIEWLRTHFNVISDDARYHRTEFLGSTREMIDINTVIQTSSTDSTSPQGNMTSYGIVSHHGSGFSTSFKEHGYLMGIARIRHNPIYQQGLHKMWRRSVLLDFYLPVFNGISEQPVYNYEIYCQRDNVLDSNSVVVNNKAFGFQEAWAEYRYKPSYISGLLRSKSNAQNLYPATLKNLDVYHLGQNFSQLPVLNQSFIEEDIPLDRQISVGYDSDDESDNPLNYPQFIFDFRFNYVCARPMPVRNIPSGLDRF